MYITVQNTHVVGGAKGPLHDHPARWEDHEVGQRRAGLGGGTREHCVDGGVLGGAQTHTDTHKYTQKKHTQTQIKKNMLENKSHIAYLSHIRTHTSGDKSEQMLKTTIGRHSPDGRK